MKVKIVLLALRSNIRNRKVLSVIQVGLLIAMSLTIAVSMDARAEFVESMAVPWGPDFIPHDSAWDPTGTHCVVVGEDVSASPASNAWHYNSASSTWTEIAPEIVAAPEAEGPDFTVGSGAGNDTSSIQTAINMASPGDTVYVWPGIYFETITIDKKISLVGHDKVSTIIDGNMAGDVVTITSDFVEMSNLTVRYSSGSQIGLYLTAANYCNFTKLNISYNYVGMILEVSSFNRIEECEIYSNGNDGVYLDTSDNNLFKGNLIQENNYGLSIDAGNGNLIFNNNIIANANQGYDNEVNTWFIALPNGGNYWSDWTSPDAEGDGIVDNPYSVAGINDNFPWAVESGWDSDTISLISEWPFDESSGQYVYDSTDNNNDGVLGTISLIDSRDPARISGLSGNALRFADDSVEVSNDATLALNDHFTLEGWVQNPDFSEIRTDEYTNTFYVAQQDDVVLYTSPGEVHLNTTNTSGYIVGPKEATSNTLGGGSVVNPDNAIGSDNFYANHTGPGSGALYVYISGDAGASYRSDLVLLNKDIETIAIGGGPKDNWGRFWQPSDFTDANFRLKIGDSSGPVYSNFKFPEMDSDCFIDGIQVMVEGFYIDTDAIHRWVDNIEVKVFNHTGSFKGTGTLTSSNFVTSYVGLDYFEATISSLPADTYVYTQYSPDNFNWYDSFGSLGSWDPIMFAGTSQIDLSGLGWSGTAFYYKVRLVSMSGIDTPILESVNVAYLSGTEVPIMSKENAYELRVSPISVVGRIHIGGMWYDVNGPVTWSSGWNHFAFTSTTDFKIVYHNGVPVGNSALTGPTDVSTYTLTFGSYRESTPFLSGDLDELKIWGRALGPDEISDYYTEMSTPPVSNIDSGRDFFGIQEAIDDVNTMAGHTITVAAGTYYESVNVHKGVSIEGEDPDTTIIDGGNLADIVTVNTVSGISMSNFTLTNGVVGIKQSTVGSCTYSNLIINSLSSWGININSNEDFNTIRNCHLTPSKSIK